MTWVLGTALAVTVTAVLALYNRLHLLNVAVTAASANVDALLTLRADLIDRLAATAAGYLRHEGDLLATVTEARATTSEAVIRREDTPDVKASGVTMKLHDELVRVEDQLAFTRAYLRERIQAYNDAVSTIPGKWLAPIIQMHPRPYSGESGQ